MIINLPKNEVFDFIKDISHRNGIKSYLIGGYVRDLLLQRGGNDIDIVVEGPFLESGINLASELHQCLPGSYFQVFPEYGTAKVSYDGLEYEFVATRREVYSENSRKPKVELGTLREDQERRDFTINALAIDLSNNNLIDPFGGYLDLQRKRIVCIGDIAQKFSEDPLRMLRCVRFSAQLGFNIDSDTFQGIQDQKSRVSILSQERIFSELKKIILSDNTTQGFKVLLVTGLLEIIFPEVYRLKGVEVKEGRGHKDNFYHTLEVLENVSRVTNDFTLRFAALLHDIGKPNSKRWDSVIGWTFHNHNDIGAKMIPKIFKRMHIPMDDNMKKIQKLTELHMRPIILAKEGVTDSAIRRLLVDAGDDIEDLNILCSADITSKNLEKKGRLYQNFLGVQQRMREIEESDRLRNFRIPINGQDIMETFGIEPSGVIGDIKEVIKDMILQGEIPNSREAAWPIMIQEGLKRGLKIKDAP